MMDPHLFRPGIDIKGRPDFGHPDFGTTKVVRFAPYVHSRIGQGYLIHKTAQVEIKWYSGHYDWMQRLEKPNVIARTVCGQSVFLNNGKKSGQVCEIPDPNAVLCGRCHGELPTFSKARKERIAKRWAKDHLGCTGQDQVISAYEEPVKGR